MNIREMLESGHNDMCEMLNCENIKDVRNFVYTKRWVVTNG